MVEPHRHADLQADLAAFAESLEGTFAFYVNAPDAAVRAAVRADEAFPAASLIKIPIMLRLLEMVMRREVRLDEPLVLTEWHKTGGSGMLQHFRTGARLAVEDACTAMIALSDNSATNLLIDVTGIAPVNAMLARLGCERTRLHRYLGKPEMPGPAGPSQAVPREMGRLLELLVARQVLTPDLCALAMAMLRRQTHRALLPRFLPEGTPVAHKTGSLNGVRHDAGVLWLPSVGEGATAPDPMARRNEGFAPGTPVVIVAMSRDVPDLRWTVDNAAEVAIGRGARLVYDALIPLLPRRR